jgi:hypothetical protein
MSAVYENCHPMVNGKKYTLFNNGETSTIVNCPICSSIHKKLTNISDDFSLLKIRSSFSSASESQSDSESELSLKYDHDLDHDLYNPDQDHDLDHKQPLPPPPTPALHSTNLIHVSPQSKSRVIFHNDLIPSQPLPPPPPPLLKTVTPSLRRLFPNHYSDSDSSSSSKPDSDKPAPLENTHVKTRSNSDNHRLRIINSSYNRLNNGSDLDIQATSDGKIKHVKPNKTIFLLTTPLFQSNLFGSN